jgi:hypothetical protein
VIRSKARCGILIAGRPEIKETRMPPPSLYRDDPDLSGFDTS